MTKSLTYKDAGVSIDAGNEFVHQIKSLISQTNRKEVLSAIGGFAGLFALDLERFSKPVLVACTDGVGTKLKIAIELETYNTIGIDLVAMCVNDLICCGAEPLFFLDYLAVNKLTPQVSKEIIEGIVTALKDINCSLLGGETAEMPGMYQPGDFDCAGFSIGAVNKDKIIDGQKIAAGNKIIALKSSGIHSNGYSLVRKIIETNNINIHEQKLSNGQNLGQALLEPTKIYVNAILKLLEKFSLLGIAHITGGGLFENLPRIFPEGVSAQIEKAKIDVPEVFKFLQDMGGVNENEMWRVFNMGVGMVIVVAANEETGVLNYLSELKFSANTIGKIIPSKNNTKEVVFV